MNTAWRWGVVVAAVASPAWSQTIELPHFYGRADVSVHASELGVDDAVVTTESNASRIGLHNSHALSETLNVIYRLEYEVDFDERRRSNDGQLLRGRNSYIGLAGAWGKFFVGIHDTPMKKAELKVDLFSDVYLSDIDNLLVGQARVSDTINYVSPKFHHLQGWVMLIPGEDGRNSSGDAVRREGEDGFADAISASLIYKRDALQLGLAFETEVLGLDVLRASGQYKFGPVTVGAILQRAEQARDSVQDGLGLVLSGQLALSDASVIKLQYAYGEDESLSDVATRFDDNGVQVGPFVSEASLLSLGYDYKLAKTTKLYAVFSQRSVDGDKVQEYQTLGVGIRHEFGDKG